MALFEKILGEGESVFRNEYALSFDYLPDLLPYRENQQRHIADSIALLLQGRMGRNLLISGPQGIGKTSAVRFVFRELESYTDEIAPIFINCWKTQTSNSVLAEMARQMGAMGAHFKATEEIWERILRAAERYKGVAIALDEIDRARDFDFLYQIAENIGRFSIILITNEKEFVVRLDARVRSRLVLEDMEFAPYKKDEIRGILEERRRVAFVPGVWGGEAFDLVVEKCYKSGDVRVGLALMREAGRATESASKKRVGVEEVKIALEKLSGIDFQHTEGLDERSKALLRIIKQKPGIETGHLQEDLKRGGIEIPDSTFRRLVQRLDKEGYIFREVVNLPGGGKSMKHYVDE